ncbi:MAG: GNAT family protein [Patescibacteria group bacterium]
MFDFNWQTPATLKDGSTVILRYPTVDDAEKLQYFINPIVKEDTFILLNEDQTLNQEKAYLANIISMMHQKTAIKICGYAENKIVAAADVTRYLYKQNHVGRLGISISQEYRGMGLGKILMTEMLKQAKDILGLKMIELTCYADNLAGQRLYTSLGFVEYGRVPGAIFYKGKYVDQLNFYKEL